MQYYIYLPGDSVKQSALDTNILGETSFKTFYASAGFKALVKIIESRPDLLEAVSIITDVNKRLTVDEFLNEIQKFKIVYDY